MNSFLSQHLAACSAFPAIRRNGLFIVIVAAYSAFIGKRTCPHTMKESEMELFNTWMMFNVVTGGAVVVYLTLTSEPAREMLSKVNYAGLAGGVFGLFSVSAVASLFL
jgi:hypothetical protein